MSYESSKHNVMGNRRSAALAAAVALVLSATPPAAAEPPADPTVDTQPAAGSTAQPEAGSAIVALTELGVSGIISFGRPNRDNAVSSVTFPVPTGMVPLALRANIELPINLRFGNVSAHQGDRTLSRIGLPAQDGAEVVIPLDGLQVSGNFVTVTLRMVTIPVEPYCWDSELPLRLANTAVVFGGAELPPRSVAEFLPPVLRRAVIALPAQPTLAEAGAAVRVATAVAVRNGQKIDLQVVRLPEGATAVDLPPGPLEREIVVREGAEKGLSLQAGPGMPTLLVSGAGDDLPAQAGLLSSDAMRFAGSVKASSGPMIEDQILGTRTTLAEMGVSGLTGRSSVVVDLNQTRFGQPLRDIRVHLIGSYTALPGTLGGEIVASIGGQVIDRWSVTPDGVIDRWVSIPDPMVQRQMSLQVGLRTMGDETDCYRVSTTVRLDNHTEIRATSANPPVPQGFQSLPQDLMPLVQIGVGDDRFNDTLRAIQIMVGLQRVSALPLNTTVVAASDALASRGSAIVIAADGWTDNSVIPPFVVNGGDITVSGADPKGQSVTLSLAPETKFGSLQTVFEGPRALMIATSNGAPGQLDQLLNWLGAERGRWSDLNGRAIIAMPDAEPVTIPNPPVAMSSPSVRSQQGQSHMSWWVLGSAAALAGLLVVGLIKRRRA